MEVTKKVKDSMIRYLLGTATPVEQEALEDSYAADPQVFEQLVAVENELMEQYARHELSAENRRAFERHVLTHPRRRARTQFAEAFINELENKTQQQEQPLSFRARWANWWGTNYRSWGLSLGLATAAILLIAGGWWMWRKPAPTDVTQQPIASVASTVALPLSPSPAMTSPAPTATTQLTTQPTAQSSAPAMLAFTLVGAVVRDGGKTQRLNVPPNTKQVQLKMNLTGEEYPQYQIQLRTSAGKEILTQTKLKPAANKQAVTVNIPSNQLPQGDYFLALSGVSADNEAEELVTYFFRVTRK